MADVIDCMTLSHAIFSYALPVFRLPVTPVKAEKNITQTVFCIIAFLEEFIKFASRNIFFDIHNNIKVFSAAVHCAASIAPHVLATHVRMPVGRIRG